jgi:hypothetical protein
MIETIAKSRELYIELLKKILLNEIYLDQENQYLSESNITDAIELRKQGRDFPERGLTMVGRLRLDNLHHCVATVLTDGIEGDLIEAGTWRGGSAILMRGILRAWDVTDRTVWVADSFCGLPAPNTELYPEDAEDTLYMRDDLRVSLEQVSRNFSRFDLLDDQVRFIKGYFSDTLPSAPVEKLAVLRLDGDMYESTIVSLRSLYDKVSPGGFIIIDDYNCYESCRKATSDFLNERGIDAKIEEIDWTGAFWRKI